MKSQHRYLPQSQKHKPRKHKMKQQHIDDSTLSKLNELKQENVQLKSRKAT